jgi:hypothetical protein
MNVKDYKTQNWHCPLLGANICDVCCNCELMAGSGAPDTLRDVCAVTKKTPQEVYQACSKCEHFTTLEDFETVSVAPGKEYEALVNHIWAGQKVAWLNGERKEAPESFEVITAKIERLAREPKWAKELEKLRKLVRKEEG